MTICLFFIVVVRMEKINQFRPLTRILYTRMHTNLQTYSTMEFCYVSHCMLLNWTFFMNGHRLPNTQYQIYKLQMFTIEYIGFIEWIFFYHLFCLFFSYRLSLNFCFIVLRNSIQIFILQFFRSYILMIQYNQTTKKYVGVL